MQIGLAQVNSMVGDFPANAKRIMQAYRSCLDQGAELVVTPAFALCGYPLLDLARHENFVGQCLQALDYLGDEVKNVPLLVGHIFLMNGEPYKAATLLQQGQDPVCITYPLEGTGLLIKQIEVSGYKLSIGIADSGSSGGKCDMFVHMDAQCYVHPEHALSMAHGQSFVCCNAVGSNDGWVFAGQSGLYDSSGQVIRRLASFEEQSVVLDVSGGIISEDDFNEVHPMDQLYRALLCGVKDYVFKGSYNGVCISWDGSLAAHLLLRIASQSLGRDHITLIDFTGNSGQVAACAGIETIDPNLKVATQILAEQFPMALSVEYRLRQIAIDNELAARGYLYLSAGTATAYQVGNFEYLDYDFGGLAVFADLATSDLLSLGEYLEVAEELIQSVEDTNKIGATEAVLAEISKGCSAPQIMKSTGLPEHLVRSIIRRCNLNQARSRYCPVKINIRPKDSVGSGKTPIIQTFVD